MSKAVKSNKSNRSDYKSDYEKYKTFEVRRVQYDHHKNSTYEIVIPHRFAEALKLEGGTNMKCRLLGRKIVMERLD